MVRPLPPPLVELRRLSVVRQRHHLLRSVDWEMREGERWAILGANGSGKTSLLRVLQAYLTPTGGDVTVCGERYGESNWPELRRRIGMVSSAIQQQIGEEETALSIVASGRDAVINLWGDIPSGRVRHARRLLREVECARLARRPWALLSQGERQRVLIARALMTDWRLLILDEPCAGLDPVARETFLGFLQRLATGPRTPGMILVTHHLEEIIPAVTHVLVLKDGRVLAGGPKARVLTSRVLSGAFGSRMQVRRHHGRYRVTVAPLRGAVA